MAGTIEEIAALIKSIKLDNELNNEDLGRVLNDIRNKVSELHDYNEAADVAAAIQQTIDSKALVDMEKIRELDETLRQLRIKVDSSADIAELTNQVTTLANNFKAGFNSVMSFANKDADAKNLLLDRMEDLEKAVKNGAMIETLRQRTDELVKGYENFISDSNLRHGNMVSTIVDLKNKLDEYSSKNNYVFGTIDHTTRDTNDKIQSLESTVSSSLGNVNTKLYSLGDDINKILNDGFDHLKYLSSNMSEAMNSNSLDVKTTLEVLKANISDFTEHIKNEFGTLNEDISEKIDSGNDKNSIINNEILDNVKELGNIFAEKTSNCENNLEEKISNVLEFINALQETISVLITENNTPLNDKLSELSNRLEEINTGYEKILVNTTEEIKNVSEAVSKTTEDIFTKLQETETKERYSLKEELIANSSSNLNAIVERIQNISDSVDSYRDNTAANLNSYLVAIRDLFTDFSSKIENSQNNTEVLEKLANLESIMNRFDVEKNENFSQLQSMIQKNTDAITALNKIENLINEHSNAKDEKLANIETLINQSDNNKNESFSQLREILNKNTEALEALNIRTGSTLGLEKIENLINEKSNTKDEKLENLEILLSRIDIEKNENFNQLQTMLCENADAIQELNNRSNNNQDIEKLENLINEHSNAKDEKLESLKNLVSEYKDTVEKLSSDIHSQSEKGLLELSELKTLANDVLPKQSALNELSTLIENRVFECKNVISDEISTVKNSITFINESLNNLNPAIDNESITMKLNELNNQLTEASQNYEHGLAILSTRLEEYVEASEQIAAITKTKLDDSSNEFSAIQNRFDTLSGQLNTLIGDSGLIEILANIRQQFNVVSELIKNEREGIIEGVHSSLSESVNNICTSLNQIRNNIENAQDKQFENSENIIFNLDSIKSDINGVVASVEAAIGEKFETLSNEFQPFELAIKDFISLNLTGAINEIKQQIELSYVNIRSEIGNTLNSHEFFSNIEDSYKESASKLSALEDLVQNTISENLNSISTTLFNINNLTESNLAIIEDISTAFQAEILGLETKIQESKNAVTSSITQDLSELKELINKNKNLDAEQLLNIILPLFDNEELIDTIRGLNKTLADKIVEFKQDSELAAQDILDVINSVNNTVDYILDVINEKFENTNNNSSKILENINTINAKLDVIAMAASGTEFTTVVEDLNSQLENIKDEILNKQSNNDDIKLIMNKLDIIAETSNDEIICLDLEEIKRDLENLTINSENILKYEELIKLINNKLDILASNENTEFFENNFNEIKDFIKSSTDKLISGFENNSNIDDSIRVINNKLDLIIQTDNSDISEYFNPIKDEIVSLKTDLTSTETKLENYLRAMDSTLDVLTSSHEENIKISNNIEEVNNKINNLDNNIQTLSNKIDIIAQSDNSDVLAEADEIKSNIDVINKKLDIISDSNEENEVAENIEKIRTIISLIDNKLDIVAQSDNEEILSEIENVKSIIEDLDNKLNFISQSKNEELSTNIDEIKSNINILQTNIENSASKFDNYTQKIDVKLDTLAQANNEEILFEIEDLKSTLNNSVSKLSSFASNTDENIKKNINELKEQISNTESNLEDYSRTIDYKLDEISQFTSVHEKLENIKSDVKESLKLEELINQLNSKVDILAMSDDSDVIDEIYGIKQLVEEQLETLQTSVEDTTNVQNLMKALNKIDTSITDIDFSRQASEIKEAVISAVVSVTNEISFIEEADEIKDFVGEKTNELHRLLMDVKHQLYTITNTADDMDMYTYTLQDVESDIAKLRLVVNEFADKTADNELAVISTNITKMSKAMDDLRNAVIDVEIKRAAKNDINDINDQVVSISSRLNKYILSRRDVDNKILDKLDTNLTAISDLDTKKFSNKVEQALIETDKKLEYTTNIITVLKNVMMYLGEWMDGTTETLTSIYDRVEFKEFADLIEEKFKQQEADIENLQNIVENTISQNELKADELQTILENRILKQEARLDRIEKTLDKLTSIIEASGSQFEMLDRIDKLDEKLSKLNTNIEKLASYVE